jgi:hypothetical protein
MLMKNLETELLDLALEALKKHVPIQVEVEKIEPAHKLKLRADLLLRMKIEDKEVRYYAEFKANLTKAHIGLILLQKEQLPYQMLLITRYVTGEMAEQLKKEEIQFIDTAGNAYINQPPLYIFIKGNRLPELYKPTPIGRAFYPTGLRVIFAFLCNPGLENKPYRDIAAVADVALGTIGWVMRELRELGFLLDMGRKGKKLIQKENLLNRWVTDYPEKLRPKLVLGRFRGDRDWWQQRTLNANFAQWGGEVAAAKLTEYLKPEIVTIYINPKHLNQLLVENRLGRDERGDVEILERFWTPLEELPYDILVHPILIYADLLATVNQRNIDTAKIVYEQHILQHIRED